MFGEKVGDFVDRHQRLLAGALAAILLSILANAMWEFFFRPGLGWLGRVFLDALTFGSQYIKDAAYRNAATDIVPRLVPLVLLMVLAVLGYSLPGFLDHYWPSRSASRPEFPRWLRYVLLLMVLVSGVNYFFR